MPFLFRQDCPDCMRFWRTGDFHHSKEIWDRYHNSGWINGVSDWQSREEMKEDLERMKKMWLRGKEYERIAKENQPSNELPEWKVKKIMSKK